MDYRKVGDPPLDPSDAHGMLARYSELATNHEVRCAHDDDECTFVKFCPRYEPEDFDKGDYTLVPDGNFVVVTCKIATTGKDFLFKVFRYISGPTLSPLLEMLDNKRIHPADLATKINQLSVANRVAYALWESICDEAHKNEVEIASLAMKAVAGLDIAL